MKKIKVLHLIENLGSGGAERLLYTNLKHLDRDLMENEVIMIFSNAEHWRKPIEDLGVPVSSLECRSPKNIVKGVVALQKKIKTIKPDLIHTHLWTSNIIGRMAGYLTGVPVISSIHNPDYEPEAISDGSQVSSVKKILIRNLDKWTAKFMCQRMIAVSNYVRQSTASRIGFPSEKTDVLYNPIDIESFQSESYLTKNEFLEKVGLPVNSYILLNVARVSPQKGLLYAIRAMPKIIEDFPNARLISLGSIRHKTWLKKLEDEISRLALKDFVFLLGERRDVSEFLVHSDVFVFPSLHEGLGIALLEAMASGRPCVASDTGPISEFLKHNKNGLLVMPRDPKALADKVSELLADEKKRIMLGIMAKQTVMSCFQPQPAADRLMEIYRSIIKISENETVKSGYINQKINY
jgi:L-malate glycosyltransferase